MISEFGQISLWSLFGINISRRHISSLLLVFTIFGLPNFANFPFAILLLLVFSSFFLKISALSALMLVFAGFATFFISIWSDFLYVLEFGVFKNVVTSYALLFVLPFIKIDDKRLFRSYYISVALCVSLFIVFFAFSSGFNFQMLRYGGLPLLGWPTNFVLVLAFGYCLLREGVADSFFRLLASYLVLFGILLSFNRVGIFFVSVIFLIDITSLSLKNPFVLIFKLALFVLIIYSILSNLDFIFNLIRFSDLLSSMSSKETSLGFRFHVLWPNLFKFLADYPFFGTGGGGLATIDHVGFKLGDVTSENVFFDLLLRHGILLGTFFCLYLFFLFSRLLRFSFGHRTFLVFSISFLLMTLLNDSFRYLNILVLFFAALRYIPYHSLLIEESAV